MKIGAPVIPDEYPIRDIPDTPWWSENYALMGSSRESRTALFFGTGRWHGDRNMWRELILLALPDGRVIFAKGYGRNGTDKGPGAAFSRLEVVEPGHKLRLTYDGPVWQSTNAELLANGFQDGPTQLCTMDLQFESTQPAWNMKGDSQGAASIAGSLHVEQIGRINGLVKYAGETHRLIDGFSIRDHSRGPRDVSAYRSHCWTQGCFPQQNTAFYVYAMKMRGSDALAMANATVVINGKFHPATVIQLDMPESVADVRRLPRLTLRSELGDMTIQAVEMLNFVVTGMVRPYDTVIGGRAQRNSAVIIDGPTRIKWDGRDGSGWSEQGYASGPL